MKYKIVENNLLLVHMCKRCESLTELYDKLETITKNQAFLRRCPDMAPFVPFDRKGLADAKKRYTAKIGPLEETECVCEFQRTFELPYSNTGVTLDGGS